MASLHSAPVADIISALARFGMAASAVGAVVLVLFIVGVGPRTYHRLRLLWLRCQQRVNYALTTLRDVIFLALTVWTAHRPYRRFALYS